MPVTGYDKRKLIQIEKRDLMQNILVTTRRNTGKETGERK